jgi:hypothetical protein
LLGLSCFHVVGLPQLFPEIVWQPDHPPMVVLRVNFPQTPTLELPPRIVGSVDAAVFRLKGGA